MRRGLSTARILFIAVFPTVLLIGRSPLDLVPASLLGISLGLLSLGVGDRIIQPELGRELAAIFLGIAAFLALHVAGLFLPGPATPVSLGVSLSYGLLVALLDLGYRHLARASR